MARAREFDEEKTMFTVASVFIKNGYAGTSISQLVNATGLLRGSLYGVYHSKAGLFNSCFAHIGKDLANHVMLADLLIVALLERASIDKTSRLVAQKAIITLEDIQAEPIEKIISERILNRANILKNNKKGRNYGKN